jgi:L-ribulose-5-phosphate 4-epimerase
MNEILAKQRVIEAGKRLVSSGLIARTWGNVSCRVDENYFVITPSGRSYEGLTPDQIVRVSISDLEWSGGVKPSSEKGVHAAVYRLNPNIHFVIHTHQFMASAVSGVPGGIRDIDAKGSQILGGTAVPQARYELPGRKALIRNVEAVLAEGKAKALLMARHGALCFGQDADEAFRIAGELERAAEQFIAQKARRLGCEGCGSFSDAAEFILSEYGKQKTVLPCPVEKNGSELQGPASIPRNKKDYHIADDELMRKASLVFTVMRPLLDDFAQIIGTDMRSACLNQQNPKLTEKGISKRLQKGNGVFIPGLGALFAGEDAEAAALVARKNCAAKVVSLMFEGVQGISFLDSLLMHQVYKRKYAKLAKKA